MKRVLSFLLVLTVGTLCHAHVFTHLTVEEGLSNNTVNTICQDGSGRMWFGTHDGANRYDGYDMVVYRHSSADSRSIQSNFVNYIYCDLSGRVWLCTADGLCRYNADDDCFDRIEIDGLRSVEQIVQTGDGFFVIGTRSTSIIYDENTGSSRELLCGGKPFVFYSAVRVGDTFIFGTASRSVVRFRFDPDGTPHEIGGSITFPKSSMSCMIPDGRGGCWAGSNGSGLYHVDLDALAAEPVHLSSLSLTRVEDLVLDGEGRLWIVSKTGICVYDPSTGNDYLVEHDPYDPSSISTSVARSAFSDSDMNIWIGTSYNGVDFQNVNASSFSTIRSDHSEHSLSDRIVKSLCIDADDVVWIGTRGGGVNRFDPVTGKVSVIADVPHALSLYCPADDPGTLYAGTYHGGIYAVDKKSLRSRRLTSPKDINDMVAANGRCFWVASLSGLFLYDMERRSLSRVRVKDNYMRALDLMTDHDGRLWVGAKESMHVYEVGVDNSLEEVTPEALQDVIRAQCMYETSDGTVWIGTSDGLKTYRNGVLEDAGSQRGSISLGIQGIETDSDGWLWLSTHRGLLRYQPSTGEICSYYASDGLQSSSFTVHSSGRSSTGILYFGGPMGVTFFDPALVTSNIISHAPCITSLSVHNKTVKPGDDSGILAKDISRTDRIVLKHNQDAFTLKFSAPNYSSEGHDRFYYRLDDFDHDWMESSSRTATYTNLGKGTYHFRVMSRNRNNVPSESEAVLTVVVRPPWYRTTSAEILFLLLAAALAIYLARVVNMRREARSRQELEGMRQQYEEKLLNAKILSYCPSGAKLAGDEEKFLSAVIRNIESNVARVDFSVEQLASLMCMSRSNLHLRIKSVTGVSPVELIMRMRMERACDLIRGGGLLLTDVAEQSGFSSGSYFSTCFKKYMGMSPSEYSSKNVRK